MNRVAITGIGVVSPVGNDLETFWHALVEGRSGIGPLTSIPTERLNVRIAAEVKNHVPEQNFSSRADPASRPVRTVRRYCRKTCGRRCRPDFR